MGDWIKKRLQAIEGNAVWWLFGITGTYMLTSLPVAAFGKWSHQPISHGELWVWSLVPVFIVALMLLVIQTRVPRIRVNVSPSSGLSPSLFITVTNLGKPTNIFAFGETIGHPNGLNDFRKGEYRIGWNDTTQKKLLLTGESSNLLIATFSEVIKFELNELAIWEVIQGKSVKVNSARWNEHPNENLPGFVLRLRIVGENTKFPKIFSFTVMPVKYTGPLEIVNLVEVA